MHSVIQRFTALFSLLLLLIITSAAFANTSPGKLFSFSVQNQQPETFSLGDRLPVSINQNLLDTPMRKGDVIEIPHRPGAAGSYRITAVNEYLEGTLSVRAEHVDTPYDRVSFTYRNGRILGNITLPSEGASFRILPGSDALHKSASGDEAGHYLLYRDPANEDILQCGVDAGHTTSSLKQHTDPLSKSHLVSPFEADVSVDGDVPIDIMIVYTEDAREWAENNTGDEENHGDIDFVISEMMNLSEKALENSGIGISLRIVYTHLTDFQEDGNDSGTDLRKLATSPDFSPFGAEYEGYMDEIHELRDIYGADLVAMLADINDTGGMAFQMSQFGGAPQLGFSINRIQQMSTGHTFIHEIGHNLGNHHSRNQNEAASGIFGGLFDYSTGSVFTVGNRNYATVMAYEEGNTKRKPYFSSPDITYNSVPTGGYDGPNGPADNVRSMNYARHIVSQYRTSEENPPVLAVDNTPVEIDTETGVPEKIRFTIGNNGNSNLHWNAEIRYSGSSNGAIASVAKSEPEGIEPSSAKTPKRPASASGIPYLENASEQSRSSLQKRSGLAATRFSDGIGSGTLYETGFEEEDHFDIGDHLIVNGWTTFPRDSSNTFAISTDDPGSGSQFLRLTHHHELDQEIFTGIQAPFPGALTSQPYAISMDLRLSSDDTEHPFFLILDESSSRSNLKTIQFYEGHIFAGIEEGGTYNFDYIPNPDTPNAPNWESGEFFNFEVRINPVTDHIQFLVNGTFLETRVLNDATRPEEILLTHYNLPTGDTFDIDNFTIRSLSEADFPRFQFRQPMGAVGPGDKREYTLEVIAESIPSDVYEFEIEIQSNDPFQEPQTIPVRMDVEATTTSSDPEEIAGAFELHQNYPNPFNPATKISFNIPDPSHVSLEVYNIQGQKVTTLIDGHRDAGSHNVTFDASSFSSGLYLYRLRAGDFSEVRKMMLMK